METLTGLIIKEKVGHSREALYDAATMLHCRDGMSSVMSSARCSPDIMFRVPFKGFGFVSSDWNMFFLLVLVLGHIPE